MTRAGGRSSLPSRPTSKTRLRASGWSVNSDLPLQHIPSPTPRFVLPWWRLPCIPGCFGGCLRKVYFVRLSELKGIFLIGNAG